MVFFFFMAWDGVQLHFFCVWRIYYPSYLCLSRGVVGFKRLRWLGWYRWWYEGLALAIYLTNVYWAGRWHSPRSLERRQSLEFPVLSSCLCRLRVIYRLYTWKGELQRGPKEQRKSHRSWRSCCREARVEFDSFTLKTQATDERFRAGAKDVESSHLADCSPHVKQGSTQGHRVNLWSFC